MSVSHSLGNGRYEVCLEPQAQVRPTLHRLFHLFDAFGSHDDHRSSQLLDDTLNE